MIRLALVEDDELYRSQLREYIDKYSAVSGEKFTVTEFSDGDEIALGYKVIIIFITNSPQYAIKGYAVDALDYVLKPVSYYAFSQRLGRAVERVARRARHFLQINAHGTAHKLDTSAIYWIENCGHDLVFHTAEGEVTAPGSMTETEEKLAQDSYFRVNKGCLVNLEHVDRMDGEDAIVHGDRVPLARARRKAFLDALNDYINGAG